MVKLPSSSQNQKASKAPQVAKNGKTTARSERKKASKHTANPTNLDSAMSAEAKSATSPPKNTNNAFQPVTPEDDNSPSGRKSPPGMKDPPTDIDVEMEDKTDNPKDDNPSSGRNSPPGMKDPPQEIEIDMDKNQDDVTTTSNKSDKTATADNRDSSQPKTTSTNNQFYALDPNATVFNPNNSDINNNKSHDAPSNESDQNLKKKIIKRKNNGLYSLKLPVNDNDNAAAEMQRSITEWFKEMREVDPSFIIYDWKNDDMSRAISKSTEITTKVAAMRHFFSGVRPRSKAGFIWMNIHIGHDGPPSELDEGMDWWYKDKKAGLYKKALQYKDSIQVCWLLYSHDKVDRDNLLEKLVKRCELMYSRKLAMALSWTQIRDGTFKTSNKPFDPSITYPYAIHIHCRTNDQEEVKALMRTTYSTSQNEFPNKMKLRYVPVIDRNSTSHLKDKIRKLRRLQIDFLNSIDHATSWEIAALEYKSHTLPKNMREMIMEIPNNENEPLFIAINEDKNTGGFVFTFPSEYEQKARDYVTEFPAYLKFKYGEDIKKYLTQPAGDRLEDAIWDAELGHVISSADKELEELAKEAMSSNWIRLSTADQQNDATNIIDDHNKEVANENQLNTPLFQFSNVNNIQRSDESVSTFGNNRAHRNKNNDVSDDGSISTMNSKNSIATRMTTVEGKMNNMDSTLNKILLSLNRIQGGSTSLPVNGETQEGETSDSAVLPASDTASAL